MKAGCDWCPRYGEDVDFSPECGATVCQSCSFERDELLKCFESWAAMHRRTPEEPPWVLEGYIARGAVTLLAGKPKAGKSTFTAGIAGAMDAEADTFVGCNLNGGPVVCVSEEGRETLVSKLGPSPTSMVLTRGAAWPKPPWPALISAAKEQAVSIGAVLLVIDSLAFWASFREGQAKDSGAAQAAMDALTAATNADLAVLLVHHQRKAGGEGGDAVRDSNAIVGAVDVLMELESMGDDSPDTHRRLVATGRFPTTPPVLVVDLDRDIGEWRAVGHAQSREEAAAMGMRERILKTLNGAEKPINETKLAKLLDVDGRKVGPPLRDLVDEGLVLRSGEGKKGNPFSYANAPPKSSPEAGGESWLKCSPPPIGGEHEHLVPSPSLGEKGEKPGSSNGRTEIERIVGAIAPGYEQGIRPNGQPCNVPGGDEPTPATPDVAVTALDGREPLTFPTDRAAAERKAERWGEDVAISEEAGG